jgi:hypothetical protein
MKRSVAVLLLATVVGLTFPQAARAGASEDAALALGAFAVFNQILTGQTIFQQFGRRDTVVVAPPPVVYAPPPPPPVVYAPPPPVVYAPPAAIVYAPPPPVVYAYPPGPPPYGWHPHGPWHPHATWAWKRGGWPKHHHHHHND